MTDSGPAEGVTGALVDSVLERAGGLREQVAVSVVDSSGGALELWRGSRMHPLFGESVTAEAATAATFGMPRAVLQGWQRRKPVLHMQLSRLNPAPVMPAAGASALRRDGDPIGGLAVESGGVLDDHAVIVQVLAAMQFEPVDPVDDASDASVVVPRRRPNGPAPLTAEEARVLVRAAVKRAADLERAVSVVVTDGAGALLSGYRTHPAAATLDLASAKAYTAVVLQTQTIDLEDWQAVDPVRSMQLSQLGPRPIIADFGGFPILRDGCVIGGLGISGAREDEDQRIGTAVLADADLLG